MINRKWLIISLFIPFLGTGINIMILFVKYIKNKSFSYGKLICGLVLPSIICAIVFLTCIWLISTILAQLGVDNQYISLFVSLIISGIVMNVIFLLYYKQTFFKSAIEKNENNN